MESIKREIRAVFVVLTVALAVAGCGEQSSVSAAPAIQGGEAYHPADASGPAVPAGVAQVAVDPFWPKPLPNNWIIGQVAGLSVDADDHIWIIHRPWTVQATNAGATSPQSVRGRMWGHDPLQATCCVTAPPVIEFDPEGNVVRAWGGPGNGYEWFNSEHGSTWIPTGSYGSPVTAPTIITS